MKTIFLFEVETRHEKDCYSSFTKIYENKARALMEFEDYFNAFKNPNESLNDFLKNFAEPLIHDDGTIYVYHPFFDREDRLIQLRISEKELI